MEQKYIAKVKTDHFLQYEKCYDYKRTLYVETDISIFA